jgi:hypothetical protein
MYFPIEETSGPVISPSAKHDNKAAIIPRVTLLYHDAEGFSPPITFVNCETNRSDLNTSSGILQRKPQQFSEVLKRRLTVVRQA